MTENERRLAYYIDMLMDGDTHMIATMSEFMRKIGAWDENGEWIGDEDEI
jgi:hypothetical protein